MYVYIYVVTLIFVYTKRSSLEGGLNVVKLGGDYSIPYGHFTNIIIKTVK